MEGSRGGWSGWEKIKRADKPRGGLYPRSFAALLFLLFASAYQPPPRPSSSSSFASSFSFSFSVCLLLLLSCPSPLYYSYFHARVRQCGSTIIYTLFPLSLCVRALGRACNARDMQSLRGPREICRQHRVEERNSQSFCLTFARPPWKFASAVTSRQREGILCLITESIARGLRFTMLHFESILA